MSAWKPSTPLHVSVAEALGQDGIAPASELDAISALLNAYIGYRSAYRTVSEERGSLLGRLSSVEGERDGYQKGYDERTTEREAMLRQLGAMESERDGYRKGYDELVREREVLLGKAGAAESERDGYRAGYADLAAERTRLVEQVSTLLAERDGFRKGYSELLDQRAAFSSKISTLESEVDGYAKGYRALEEEKTRLVGRLSSLEAQVADYARGYGELEEANTRLLGRVSTLAAESEGYAKGYRELQDERAGYLQQIGTLTSERAGFERAYDEVSAARNILKSDLELAAAERRKWQSAFDGLKAFQEELRSRNAELEERIDGAAAALPGRMAAPTRSERRRGSADGDIDAAALVVSIAERGPSDADHLQALPDAGSGDVPMINPGKAGTLVNEGRAKEHAGDREGAVAAYMAASRVQHGFWPAKVEMTRIAKVLFSEGIEARNRGEPDVAVSKLARALELNPSSQEVRDNLKLLIASRNMRDLTTECLIFPDAARANGFYRTAIQTCMDFVVYGGIPGDILEFGVLGGWTARHFSEIARDMGWYGDIYLFDSFEGLPRQKSDVDLASWDVQRGVWSEEMKLPEAWEEQLGATIDVHVHQMLGTVVGKDRIKVRRGFFSESLKEPIGTKAAIVHLDCDLYQSTVDVFLALERDDVLQDGSVLMFDDWNCNRANPDFGQRRAFREFMERGSSRWSASHYFNYGFNCAAFILHEKQPRA